MLKSKSDKSITDFFRSGSSPLVLLLLVAGILLLLLSGVTGNDEKAAKNDEERTAELCSMVEGAGDCRVMMTYREGDGEKAVYAVAILCDGADSARVRRDLTELVCSLYGIGSNRVSILRLDD